MFFEFRPLKIYQIYKVDICHYLIGFVNYIISFSLFVMICKFVNVRCPTFFILPKVTQSDSIATPPRMVCFINNYIQVLRDNYFYIFWIVSQWSRTQKISWEIWIHNPFKCSNCFFLSPNNLLDLTFSFNLVSPLFSSQIPAIYIFVLVVPASAEILSASTKNISKVIIFEKCVIRTLIKTHI